VGGREAGAADQRGSTHQEVLGGGRGGRARGLVCFLFLQGGGGLYRVEGVHPYPLPKAPRAAAWRRRRRVVARAGRPGKP
jgi:hypothetical protein